MKRTERFSTFNMDTCGQFSLRVNPCQNFLQRPTLASVTLSVRAGPNPTNVDDGLDSPLEVILIHQHAKGVLAPSRLDLRGRCLCGEGRALRKRAPLELFKIDFHHFQRLLRATGLCAVLESRRFNGAVGELDEEPGVE